MTSDLRFAARLLAKNPLFAAGVIGLLAVGVAANTVIFSLVDALLLRPLPVRDPDRLVRVITIREPLGVRSQFLFEEEVEVWRTQVHGFEDLLAWSEQDMFAEMGGSTQRARVHFVTENFYSALGAKAEAGRLLTSGEELAPVTLSYPYWQRRFGGDPGVIGRTMTLEGHKVIIAGVTKRGFNGMTVETTPDLRAPIAWLRRLRPNLFENKIYCEVAARLRAGAAPEAVRAEAEAIWRNGWREKNKTDPGEAGRFAFEPAGRGISRMRTQFSGVLWLLMGGVGLLALMICANVAGLMMARTAGRQSELAVRVAMGATRGALVRQLFAEGFLLMLGGAAGAMILSWLAIPLLVDALPPVRDFTAARLTLALEITPDWRVLAFALAVSLAAALLFALAPAFLAARRDLHPLLKEARSGGGWRGRQALVIVQVALSTLLLTGAGLTVLTLQRLESLNAGFDREHIVTFNVDPDMAGYQTAEKVALRERLLERARALPEVEAAAAAGRGLMRGTGVKGTLKRAGERARPEDFLNISMQGQTREYFETMGIPWLRGRNFTGRENPAQLPKPVIVNEAFVRRFAGPGGDVLGEKFGYATASGEPAKPMFEVIGVVGNAKYRSLREPFQPILYGMLVPAQDFILHLRTRSAPEAVIGPMRGILRELDSRLSFIEVTTLASEVSASLWAERVAAFLATVLAGVAALIAAAGLYALLAFAVMQRRREIGIRVALGAAPGDVLRLIGGRAVTLALAGAAAGLAAAWVLAPKIAAILYEVDPRDGRALAAAGGVVLVAALISAALPALRAARIDPASVLRQE